MPPFPHFYGWLLLRDLSLWSLRLNFDCWRTLSLLNQQDEPECLGLQQAKCPGSPKDRSWMLMIYSQQDQRLLHGLTRCCWSQYAGLTCCHCFVMVAMFFFLFFAALIGKWTVFCPSSLIYVHTQTKWWSEELNICTRAQFFFYLKTSRERKVAKNRQKCKKIGHVLVKKSYRPIIKTTQQPPPQNNPRNESKMCL